MPDASPLRVTHHVSRAGLVVFVLSLLVYALTLAPDITWAHDSGDGGDLITAVMTGGIPHPPGYPTYLLLASPLARLPWGNPAWRLNLFSALGAAGAGGLIALTVTRLSAGIGHESREADLAGVGAGLALAFSPVLWSQAVIAEVYALGALFAALLVFLAVCRFTGRQATLFGAALGLALGAHLPLILCGLLAFVGLERRWKSWAWAGFGLLLGLTVFLALPVRALNHAPVNWGDASTPDGFWWLVSAQLYRRYVFALPFQSVGTRLIAWASMTARQFTPVGVVIGVWGFWRLWREKPRLAQTMLVMFAGFSIFAIGYNTTDSYVYLIPAFVFLVVWLGAGLAEILSRLDLTGFRRLALSGLLVLLLPLTELLIGWSVADIHTDRTAVMFGQATLARAPDRAVLLTAEDAHTFTLWYFRYTRDQRPDVLVVDRDLLAMRWYRATIARESGLSNLDESPDPLAALSASGRPVCRVSLTNLECN
jgi:hypothetical protein